MDAVTIVDSGIAVVDIVIAAGDGVAVAVDAVRFILDSVDKKLTSYVEDVSIDLTVFMTGCTSILPTTFNWFDAPAVRVSAIMFAGGTITGIW